MPAAVELLSILRSNAALRELFGDLLGGAPRLADVVAARPHVLDAVIDPAARRGRRRAHRRGGGGAAGGGLSGAERAISRMR